jgi:hypothetical protein
LLEFSFGLGHPGIHLAAESRLPAHSDLGPPVSNGVTFHPSGE